uniref:Uncharacterized protein n=1 Tax=Schistosoma haematobium TaxID=6185 RepID=A0A095CDE9_SCHHA
MHMVTSDNRSSVTCLSIKSFVRTEFDVMKRNKRSEQLIDEQHTYTNMILIELLISGIFLH